MTDLKSQRRLASQILKIGQNRVWINPEHMSDVESAITREEVRKLIHEKVIVSLPEKGVSRSRAKVIREKKRKGRLVFFSRDFTQVLKSGSVVVRKV